MGASPARWAQAVLTVSLETDPGGRQGPRTRADRQPRLREGRGALKATQLEILILTIAQVACSGPGATPSALCN